jgi:hypothetical protein
MKNESPLNNPILYCSGGNSDGFNYLSSIYSPAGLYCSGGDNDGHHFISTGNLHISSPFYCFGGDGDGTDRVSDESYLFDVVVIFSGDDNDGYHAISTGETYFSPPSVYLSGGNGQGFDFLSVSGYFFNPVPYYSGNSDGFTHLTYSGGMAGNYYWCLGGNNEGSYSLSTSELQMGNGIWLGIASNSWNDAANWKGNAIPGITTDVYIPSGCLYYPLITTGMLAVGSTNGACFCNSLVIDQGGALNNNRYLFAYGNVTVSGLYQANNNFNNCVILFQGGQLTVNATGLVIIGNQSGGNLGTSDLKVDGGILEIEGGTVEIDDQFNLVAGEFNMTSGMLFANKYGRGSVYDDQGPGAFYVSNSASGTVSGGMVKVVGRATRNDSVAVKISSPAFDFTGTSVFAFVQGVVPRTDDVEFRTIAGARMNMLTVDAPNRTVWIRTNAVFHGNSQVGNDSRLSIFPGKNVTFIP